MFFFNDTATTEIYTLSLHDALPICRRLAVRRLSSVACSFRRLSFLPSLVARWRRDGRQPFLEGRPEDALDREEHTSELQSRQYIVCRLLLENKRGRPRITAAEAWLR